MSQLPTSMRAAILRDDEPRLQITEIPVPVPGPGEALVRVTACGVCHTDLHVMKSEVVFPRPAVLGHEISGTVVAIGAGSAASALSVGDAVVGGFIMPCTECDACRAGRDDLCGPFFSHNRLNGHLYDGTTRLADADGTPIAMYSMAGLAEYAVVPLAALAPRPAGLDPVNAAVLGCAGMTAYGAVVRAAGLEAGMSVAVVAVGGVGSSIVQVARAAGASTIIAVDVDAGKLEWARALGADHTVDSSSADPVAAVRELTAGRGVDVAIEALGRAETFAQATRMLADGGTMVAVGIAATGTTAPVEITPLVRRSQRIVGSFGARTRVDLPAVVELASSGEFALDRAVSARYDFAEVDRAYADLSAGRITGRAVVVME